MHATKLFEACDASEVGKGVDTFHCAPLFHIAQRLCQSVTLPTHNKDHGKLDTREVRAGAAKH